MTHLIRGILGLVLFGALLQNTHAYLPLVDNQPLTVKSCPLGQAVSTESWWGRVGSIDVRCDVDGVDVVYTVTVPKGCENGGCGLIFDVHGMSMNARQQNAGTKLRQHGWAAERFGAPRPYIVVQPNLTDLFDRNSLIDFESVFGGAYLNEIDNLVYFANHVIDVYRVNTNRTHMYGFSRGGKTVNAFYCDLGRSRLFASYAVGGMDLECPVNKPMMLIIGDGDFAAPNGIPEAEAAFLGKSGVTTRTLVNDPGYSTPDWVWTWYGIKRKGRHHHKRFTSGDEILETIRHSGSTLPLAGHCHAADSYNSWIVCYANMETGRKLIDFFIQNPR
jgi:poly(3-hydroxybutyrate) depolymerase